jgi:hypothetical protein
MKRPDFRGFKNKKLGFSGVGGLLHTTGVQISA